MKVIAGSEGFVPIKMWTEGVPVDNNAKSQLLNVASMPFIFKHVAVMPDVHVGRGCCIGAVIPTKGALIPSAVGVDLGCFVGNTWIPTWDGPFCNIKELSKTEDRIGVYSYDITNKKIVKGMAKAVQTRKNAELMKVVLGKGLSSSSIICTPDHKFLGFDGHYKEAKDLGVRDKLRGYNDNVLTVEYTESLLDKDDVYCLQVEEYHNFALESGVFVHNCGMLATKLEGVRAEHLPDNMRAFRQDIEKSVPYDDHKEPEYGWNQTFRKSIGIDDFKKITDKYDDMGKRRKKPLVEVAMNQLGTLGSGNHFIEVCLDTNDDVWVMLHSGSRGVGNVIGTYFIEKAKREMERFFISLPDKDLSYFSEGSEYFDDYVKAVGWAQNYASKNREKMIEAILDVVRTHIPIEFETGFYVNCHHNYVNLENHFGKNVWVTRKGAVSAREGEYGIIPGSMGAKSFIVEGKGNPESFNSCSHGAGRVMSRTKAKERVTLKEHRAAISGIECRKDRGVLDETPSAYKNIDDVIAAQENLIDVKYQLKQVLCVKG